MNKILAVIGCSNITLGSILFTWFAMTYENDPPGITFVPFLLVAIGIVTFAGGLNLDE